MTPLQFAKASCSNWEWNGACAGIGISDDGSLYSFGRKPKCVLGTTERCQFFEECVMPTTENLDTARGQQLAKEHEQARKLYRLNTGARQLGGQTGRICPQCKDRELEPYRRLCYVCAAENKLKAKNANRGSD